MIRAQLEKKNEVAKRAMDLHQAEVEVNRALFEKDNKTRRKRKKNNKTYMRFMLLMAQSMKSTIEIMPNKLFCPEYDNEED